MSTTTATQDKGIGTGTSVILVLSAGALAYFGFDFLNKRRASKEIEKSGQATATTQADIIRTKNKITALERGKNVTGKNASLKTVTVNLPDLTKEIMSGLLNSYKGKYDLDIYRVKTEPNGQKVQQAFFEIPKNGVNMFLQMYTIYTQRDFITDYQNLDARNRGLIKGYLNASLKK